VTDPASGCAASFEVAPVDVWDPVGVTASLGATCSSSFTYSATPSGGSPAGVSYSWAFSGDGTPSPSSSSSQSGTVAVSPGDRDYTGTVTVHDLRDDGPDCNATDSDSARPYDPITVSIAPSADPMSCPSMTTDAVTYWATVSGGDGSYSYAWTGASCSGPSCLIDPADNNYCADASLYVTVDDGSPLCPAATSETETYSKVTTVTWSNN
jgi:hypothetical protein